MKYLDQDFNDIQFYLIEGGFSRKQFQIMQEDQLFWGEFSVDYGILGESHFVSFKYCEKRLTEICACVPSIDVEESVIVHSSGRLSEMKGIEVKLVWESCNYLFKHYSLHGQAARLEIEKWDSTYLSSDVSAMKYIFPAIDHKDDKPITEIRIERSPQEIVVRTVHTYPNQNVSVFTCSSLTALS